MDLRVVHKNARMKKSPLKFITIRFFFNSSYNSVAAISNNNDNPANRTRRDEKMYQTSSDMEVLSGGIIRE